MDPTTSRCFRMQLGLASVGGKRMVHSCPGGGHAPKALFGPSAL